MTATEFEKKLLEFIQATDEGGCGCCAGEPDLTEKQAVAAIKALILENLPEECLDCQHGNSYSCYAYSECRTETIKRLGLEK